MSAVLICAANRQDTLRENLLRSPIPRAEVDLHLEHDPPSSAVAYNRGLAATDGDIVLFVHQDVYLPAGFWARLRAGVETLAKRDQCWGVLSCIGRRADGSLAGRVWSSGLAQRLGSALDAPVEATAVDELLLVIRRDSGLRFDKNLPGFHCYAADLVATAAEQGMKTYVADMPVVHNSQPVRRLDDGYITAYRYMQRKWRHRLPLDTLIAPITRWGLPLYRVRLRLLKKRLFMSHTFGRRQPDPEAIAERCGFTLGDTPRC